MAKEFIGRFDGRDLGPVNAAESEARDQLTRGVDYRVVCTRVSGRSIKHHGLLFALISIARENYGEPITTEAVKEALKLRTGHVRVMQLKSGEVIMFPASISFESMDQDAFNEWFPRAVDVLCRDFCPGLDVLLAAREIEKRAGIEASRRQLSTARAA